MTTVEPTTTATPNGAAQPTSSSLAKTLSPAAEAWALRQREATAISKSTLLPKEFHDNMPNILIAMEIAERIGASIFMVAQNMDVIHGRPSWRASFLIATVNASKRFTPLRFKFEGSPGTDTWGCRAVAKDLADGEPCVGALITIALAKSEGWYGKGGSKWQTMPEQMLMYRSAAWWTRVYAPELSLGIRTSDEEEDAIIDVVGTSAPMPAAGLQALIDSRAQQAPQQTSGGIAGPHSPTASAPADAFPAADGPTEPRTTPAASPDIDWGARADELKEAIADAKSPEAKKAVAAMVKAFVEGPPIPPGDLALEVQRFLKMATSEGR